MGRGLDGYFDTRVGGLCSFEGPRGAVPASAPRAGGALGLEQFPVALAWGKHLFPFRTEQLSPTAPMVLGLHGPGRVGRRRFFIHESPHRAARLRSAPHRSFGVVALRHVLNGGHVGEGIGARRCESSRFGPPVVTLPGFYAGERDDRGPRLAGLSP